MAGQERFELTTGGFGNFRSKKEPKRYLFGL